MENLMAILFLFMGGCIVWLKTRMEVLEKNKEFWMNTCFMQQKELNKIKTHENRLLKI